MITRCFQGALAAVVLFTGCYQAAEKAPTPTPTPQTPFTVSPDTLLERRVLYYPNKKSYGSRPSGVETLELLTADGLTLKAWHLPNESATTILVYFHGNGGNLTSLVSQFHAFKKLEVEVLAIDYRGFGDSQGDPSEEGLYLDALAAFDKAKELSPNKKVVLYGRSLGGGVASYVATQRPADGLILESTFTSAKEVARFSHGERGAEAIDAFDSLSRLADYQGPTLIFHGTQDKTIPSRMSQQLHKAIPNSKLWLVEGATHNDLRKIAKDEYFTRLRQFLKL